MSTEKSNAEGSAAPLCYAEISDRIYTRGRWEQFVLRNSIKGVVSTPRQPIKRDHFVDGNKKGK